MTTMRDDFCRVYLCRLNPSVYLFILNSSTTLYVEYRSFFTLILSLLISPPYSEIPATWPLPHKKPNLQSITKSTPQNRRCWRAYQINLLPSSAHIIYRKKKHTMASSGPEQQSAYMMKASVGHSGASQRPSAIRVIPTNLGISPLALLLLIHLDNFFSLCSLTC